MCHRASSLEAPEDCPAGQPDLTSAFSATLTHGCVLAQLCKACFFEQFESEVHETITQNRLFSRGDRVAIGASGKLPARHSSLLCVHSRQQGAHVAGGKDSTVLAHVLSLLNRRHGYGLVLLLLSIDEGISGYRDDSLETVKRNEVGPSCASCRALYVCGALVGAQVQYGIPLTILSYEELYGWTMDQIVAQIGTKGNCTFCGVFRRQALDRGAWKLQADKVATGALHWAIDSWHSTLQTVGKLTTGCHALQATTQMTLRRRCC